MQLQLLLLVTTLTPQHRGIVSPSVGREPGLREAVQRRLYICVTAVLPSAPTPDL